MAKSSELAKYYHSFVTDASTVVKISKTTSILWVNAVLKKKDATISKVFPSITYEHRIVMMWSMAVFCLTELPSDVSSCV